MGYFVMIIKNATIWGEDFSPVKKDIKVSDGLIEDIGCFASEDGTDYSGCTVVPGFIDIHIHGARLADSSSGSTEEIQTISRYLAENGITSFCPTTMTLPEAILAKAFEAVRECMGKEEGAYIHGINMEGPFISLGKKGAQAAEHIRRPDVEEFNRLNAICPIKLADIAPEEDGAIDFAKEVSKTCTVSAAHTSASYEQARLGFENGFSHATHLFNAMTPIQNRAPGVPTAVFDDEKATAELICDGLHNHPAILRMAFSLLGEDRAVVISDSMSAAGMGDGEYELGGQTVYVNNGKATLADGTIAASTTNIFAEFKNLLNFGIDFKAALKACTINPAKVVGADKFTGSIEKGKRADLLVLDSDLNLKAVYIGGKQVI